MTKQRTQKLPPKTPPKLNVDLSVEQSKAVKIIKEHTITFINGKAGSGKTLTALYVGLSALLSNEINTIFVTRPYVSADENMGFLPGDITQKMDPYLIPIWDNLKTIYPKTEQNSGKSFVEKYMEKGDIEIAPIGFMRGRTFCDSYLILDEAQNITIEQLRMAMTRLGKGSKMIICGDLDQCDLKCKGNSGLLLLDKVISRGNLSGYMDKIVLKDNHRDPIVELLLNEFDKIYP